MTKLFVSTFCGLIFLLASPLLSFFLFQILVTVISLSFLFRPPGTPESVSNCSVKNESTTTLVVTCTPGDSGGLRQTFFLEVYDENNVLYGNYSSKDDATFIITLTPNMVKSSSSSSSSNDIIFTSNSNSLSHGDFNSGSNNSPLNPSKFTLAIYSSNNRGRGPVVFVTVPSFIQSEKQTRCKSRAPSLPLRSSFFFFLSALQLTTHLHAVPCTTTTVGNGLPERTLLFPSLIDFFFFSLSLLLFVSRTWPANFFPFLPSVNTFLAVVVVVSFIPYSTIWLKALLTCPFVIWTRCDKRNLQQHK